MDVFARLPAVLRRRAEQRAETEKNVRIRREKQDRMRDEVGVLLRDQARVGGRGERAALSTSRVTVWNAVRHNSARMTPEFPEGTLL